MSAENKGFTLHHLRKGGSFLYRLASKTGVFCGSPTRTPFLLENPPPQGSSSDCDGQVRQPKEAWSGLKPYLNGTVSQILYNPGYRCIYRFAQHETSLFLLLHGIRESADKRSVGIRALAVEFRELHTMNSELHTMRWTWRL